MKLKSILTILVLAFTAFATIGCSGAAKDDYSGETEQARDPNAKGGPKNMQQVDPNK